MILHRYFCVPFEPGAFGAHEGGTGEAVQVLLVGFDFDDGFQWDG